jgi:hypothetical protein
MASAEADRNLLFGVLALQSSLTEVGPIVLLPEAI